MIVFIYLERLMNLRKRVGIERGNRGRGKENREKTEELVFCLSSLWLGSCGGNRGRARGLIEQNLRKKVEKSQHTRTGFTSI